MLTLLALAADRHGASFWGRDRMASRLGLTRAHVDEALRRLLTAQLVAHRPWHPGDADGVWQLLPVPAREQRAPGEPTALRDLLAKIGVTPDTRPNRRIPADPGRR